MDETKVQIGEEVLLDIGIHSEWYISSIGYDGESVDVALRRKADRNKEWWLADAPQKELTAKCLNCHNAKACKENHWDGCIYEPQTDYEDIYPLVIIEDRYTGVYSNGEYTAWNMYFDEIPQDIDGDDISCYDFWHSYNGIVGLGKTPNEAIEDLRKKLNAERNEK